MAVSIADIVEAFETQSRLCRSRGAILTASIIDGARVGLQSGGPVAELLADLNKEPGKAGLALRIAGAVHYLVIKGRADALASIYEAPRALDAEDAASMLSALVSDHEPVFRSYLSRPPQTNEINRLAALIPAFSEVSAATGLPLDLYELGASGGLLLCPDQCAVDYGAFRWGDGPLQLSSEWRGEAPTLVHPLTIRERAGCDRDPIEFSDPEQLDIAHSYIWPEHPERRKAFDAAIAATNDVSIKVDQADAIGWLDDRDIPKPGAASVVFTSVFAVYLSNEDAARLHQIVAGLGAQASAAAPVAFVQFEPEPRLDFFKFTLDLTVWPGGKRRRIAVAQAHGQWVEPLSD